VIIVIQCAGTKQSTAGHLRTKDGKNVMFVAHPESASDTPFVHYAHPDGKSDQGGTWRDVLERYNAENASGEGHLLRALDLYDKPAYRQLAEQVGYERTYILSAGWGLIRGDFPVPNYNITFPGNGAPSYVCRKMKKDVYRDFSKLPDDTKEPIYFFGGLKYLPLFFELTCRINAPKTVFFRSTTKNAKDGYIFKRIEMKQSTTWYYTYLGDFLKSHC
jgi:hypothetical protein